MLLIYPPSYTHEETNDAAKKEVVEDTAVVVWEKKDSAVKSKDWAYMEMSGQVLRNPPDTWKVYPDNEEGKKAIIDMEYHELQNAIAINAPKEDVMRELVHLGSATLAMWRVLNAAE